MMNAIPVFLSANNEMGFGDRASTAGVVTLQGMLTIFLVLAILWAAIEILHFCLAGKKEKKKNAPELKAEAAPVAEEILPDSDTAAFENDGATVAAITAAISAYLAEEGVTGSFRVVSFKRAAANHRRSKF